MDADFLQAPFPWFGGKSRVAADVWARFGDVPNYVEPFAGSLAVLLGRPHDPQIETVNDLDGFIANFWRALQHAPDEVAKWADWPVNECIPAGTMIATPNGEIPVEDVRAGMIVLGEENGRTVCTRVIADRRSVASEFYRVGALSLTGNHPVWTLEDGYIEARKLAAGMHVKTIRWPVCENDLVMLQYGHEQAVGDLHTVRPKNARGSLCRSDVPGQEALQRTHFARHDGRKDASRLLDTLIDCGGGASVLSSGRDGGRRRLARRRAGMDCQVQAIGKTCQSYRWGRWYSWTPHLTGNTSQTVRSAQGRAVSAWAYIGNEGQAAYTGGIRENTCRQQGAQDARQYEAETIRIAQTKPDFARTARQDAYCQQRDATNARISAKSNGCPCARGQESSLPRNGRSVPVNQCGGAFYRGEQGGDSICTAAGYSLQGPYSQAPIAVYNFQTTTGNYYANRILVHNCDLTARHAWLVREHLPTLAQRLEGDPDYYDAKIAGWWVWGLCSWIGSGWCSGVGPWQADENGVMAKAGGNGDGVKKARPHLGNAGRGINRKLPHLGNAGRGINRQLPHLNTGGKRPELGSDGRQLEDGQALYDYMRALAARLRRVRVCCGDWSRVCGPSPTVKLGVTGVFLDPPYSDLANRDPGLYATDSLDVAHECRKWALEQGDNPLLRIALCGYTGEHDGEMTDAGWTPVYWKAAGGYGSQADANGNGRANSHREVIWFSPHCLQPHIVAPTLFDFEDDE